MINIKDNDLWRGGEKVGYIEGDHIVDHAGKKLGHFSESEKKIYDESDKEVGKIVGNHITFPGDEHFIRLEDNQEQIVGGVYSDVVRAAIRIFLGE